MESSCFEMTKVLDWQKHWNGNTKVQTIAEWMWLQNSNNIVAILRQLEQSILSIAAKILETLALSILLSFTPNHELEHWAVGGSEILNIFDGKIFFGLTGIPIRNTALANKLFALAEPVPLTLANLITNSLIDWILDILFSWILDTQTLAAATTG